MLQSCLEQEVSSVLLDLLQMGVDSEVDATERAFPMLRAPVLISYGDGTGQVMKDVGGEFFWAGIRAQK